MNNRTIPHSRASALSPGRIALGYAVISILWIAISDAIVTHYKLHPFLLTIKGAVFVFVTACLLYITTRRLVQALHRLNSRLQALSNCNKILLRATDEQSLLEEICRIVCEEAGYRMAWVGYAEHDEAKSVRPVAWTGTEEEYLANLGLTWADTDRGSGPTGTAIRSGKTCCIEDFATDHRLLPWRERALPYGYRSGSALPLKDEHDNAFGSLSIYSTQPNAFAPEEIRLLEELAGNLAFGIVTLRSRAARKRVEEALSRSEASLAEAQRLSHVGSWDLDVDQNRLSWSDEVFRIFGIPLGTPMTYESFLAAVHPDDVALVDQAWKKALAGAAYDIEHRILVGEEVRWVREKALLEFDAAGATKGVGTVQDITDTKRAEEERRESAERFRAIADYTFDWENWIGVDGKLLWVNPAVERMTGYSVGECMVMPDFPIPIVVDADREMFARQMREAIQGSSRNDFQFRVRRKDGRLVWVAASWQPIYDSRGTRLGHRSSMRDITERKRAEEAVLEERILERTRIARELHDTLLQTFQATLIHVGVAFKQLEPGETKQKLGRALELAGQALTEARESIQALRSSRAEDDIVAALKDVAEAFTAEHPSSTVFHVKVRGTPLGLNRGVREEAFKIGREALRNAFRHACADRIQLEISFDTDAFRLVVTDDGKGIDSKVLAQGGREGHYGLFGIRERAKLIGGELGLRSEPGGGTELRLNIPGPLAYATPGVGRSNALERGTARSGG